MRAQARRGVARRIAGAVVGVRVADGGLLGLHALALLAASGGAEVPVGFGARRAVGERRVRTQTRRRVARRVAGTVVGVRVTDGRLVGLHALSLLAARGGAGVLI